MRLDLDRKAREVGMLRTAIEPAISTLGKLDKGLALGDRGPELSRRAGKRHLCGLGQGPQSVEIFSVDGGCTDIYRKEVCPLDTLVAYPYVPVDPSPSCSSATRAGATWACP